ncbi:ABC transporter ATP-binding protein [Arthrobacter sp. ok362]|uniref:ABC transporter ATP-binding protein n=1 Tax=Arthrobacter sp. ok362 TaxID=1761745 RepID=UPI000888E508|nr:ABC transporter ATP-binding protein [Arthrobacter sp. ok362]SDM03183.1 ATP-binding cassette, subfamily B, MsbA [Arthrobacter sp. ok362]
MTAQSKNDLRPRTTPEKNPPESLFSVSCGQRPHPSKTRLTLANAVKPQRQGAGRRSRWDLSTLRELWRFKDYGRPERKSLVLGVLMNGGQMAANLAAPWPLALVINDLLQDKGQGKSAILHTVAGWFGGSSMAMLLVAASAVVLITAAAGMFSYLGDMYMNGSGQRITSRIRADVFAYTQRLPMAFHDRQAVGELTSRVVSDTSTVESTLRDVGTDLVPSVLTLVGTAAVMVAVDWRLGLIGLVVAPLVFLTANHFAGLTRQYARRKRAATGGLTGLVTESLMGIRTVHAFGNQQVQDQRFATQNDNVLSLSLRSVKVSAKFSPTLQLVAAVGTALVLFVGGCGALNGWWQVGVLVVVTSYLKSMLAPMKSLAKLAPSFTQGAASAQRIADILDQPTDHQGTDEPLPARVDGRIELRKVGLDYGTGRGPVFTDVDLTVTPGERIALLGDNGAGKSTLLSVIGGLYRPTTGQVLLDGHSVPDVPEHWLHQQVAMVLQDTFLFSGTLVDNIRYGRPAATDAEVAAAAEAALVSEFAEDLPDGLDTTVGTGGTGLSGGQRQRVGIARALLVDAPVVLLDEPTAGLDVHAEELVVQALGRLVEGRTIIATTHRPAVTALATRTVYLRQGGVLDAELPETAPADPSADRTRLAIIGAL